MVPLLALEFWGVRGCCRAFRGGEGLEGVGEPLAAEAPGVAPEGAESAPVAAEAAEPEPPPPPPPVWQGMVPPTPQKNLLHPDAPGVLQPTASGRLESAKFGSVRTANVGGKLVPRFHEGVDIAPTERDRKREPLDGVFAVADGRVAFVNGKPGNSEYGRYVVVEHADPSLGVVTNARGNCSTGTVYTLYAHLAEVRFGIREGREVKAGEELARMGHSAASGIPVDRSHLHWEVGLMLNPRYAGYTRANKITNVMGAYNGLNLFGIDPLDFYAAHARNPELAFAEYLETVKPAFEVLARRGHFPDFFAAFPSLWVGPRGNGEPFWLAFSESGMPLKGRLATAEEASALGNQRQKVWRADREVLGRNGRALVTQRKGKWELTDKGIRHLDLLFY